MKVKPRLIVGLGNPGSQYALTYHNVGFLAIDYLNKRRAPGSGHRMLKSDAYMNQSGNFVNKTLKKYKINPAEILIIHDDSDIELGKYKLSFGRGSAGHRGVESIIKSLGTKNFWRLRIGVGQKTPNVKKASGVRCQASRTKAGEFVLKKISKKDLAVLGKVFEEARKICL